jgi:hypothetical protein
MCPILAGLSICVLFSQGKTYVSYILAGLFICVVFSQGKTYVSYSHRDEQTCPIFLCSNFPSFSTAYVSHRRVFSPFVSYFPDVSYFQPCENRTHFFSPVRIGHK